MQSIRPDDLAAVPCAAVLDPVQWSILSTSPGQSGSLLTDFLALFFRDEPSRVGRLKPLLDARQAAELGRLAHSIAGTAAMLGALELRQAAAELEQAALRGNWEQAEARLAAMLAAWHRLLEKLAAEGYPLSPR